MVVKCKYLLSWLRVDLSIFLSPAINLLEVFSQTMLWPAHTQLGHARIPAGREYYAMFCESFCHLFHCFVFLSLHKTLEQTMFVIKVIHKV